MASYSVHIDWDYTGSGAPDFAQADDNITAYMMACSGKLGLSDDKMMVANVGSCSLTVRNTSRRFSPGNSSGPLYGKLTPGKPVRVQFAEGGTATIFLGFIKSITPSAGGQAVGATGGVMSDRLCQIECVDVLEKLRQARIGIPVLTNRYAHQLVQIIINRALNAPVATNEINFPSNPANGNTIAFSETVNGVEFYRQYTLLNTITAAPNQIKIGTNKEATLENVCAAINGGAGSGTTYSNATTPIGIFSARPNDSYYYQVLRDAPIRYYRYNESAGTTAADLGENAANGTYSGVTLSASGCVVDDNAVSFDGVDDYVSHPTLDLRRRSFTIEAWIRPAASPPAQQAVWGVYAGTGAREEMDLLLASDGSMAIYFNGLPELVTAPAGTIIFTGTYHVAATYDAVDDICTLYVNGVAINSGSAGPYEGVNPSITAGATVPGFGQYKGVIDEFAIYLHALSPARIAAHSAARLVATGVRLEAALPGAVGNGIAAAATGAVLSVNANFAGGVDYPTSPASAFEDGVELIPFAGDDWKSDSTNALTACKDVVETERGLLWATRTGTLQLKNRGYIFRRGAAAAALTLDSEHQSADAELSDEDLYNAVEVTIQPREAKAVGLVGKINAPVQIPGRWGTERWSGNAPIKVFDEQGSKVVKVQFNDPDTGIRCAAQNIVLPLVATTNYTLNEQSDGSGVEYTNGDPATGKFYVFFSVAVSATAAEVSVVNKALGPLYLRKLEIFGEALVKYDPITAVAEDEASQSAYGKRTLSTRLPMSGNQQYAEALGAYLLGRYRTPAFRLKRLSFDNLTIVDGVALHTLDLGDVISYTDYQHAVSAAKHLIRGVQWNYNSPASGRFSTSFDVMALDDSIYGVYDAGAPRGKFDQCKFGL